MKILSIALLLLIRLLQTNAQELKDYTSVMRTAASLPMWDGYKSPMYGFAKNAFAEPVFPAQTVQATEGDSVHILGWNISRDHHTIHLHGLDVDMANDGDPMTSFELDHQTTFTYKFKATHAGTYLYHCHTTDVVHVQMGMYGLVVVRPANPKTAWTGGPSFDKEYSYLMSELDSTWHNNPPKQNMTDMTVKIPKYSPTYFLVNCKSKQKINDTIKAGLGNKVYLRLANIGFYDNLIVFPSELNASVIDSDGRPLPNAIRSDSLWISPGERYGVMVSSGQTALGNIQINFVDMNAYRIDGVEYIPFIINETVSTEEALSIENIKIHPIPVDGRLYISSSNSLESVTVKVTNVIGEQIFTTTLRNNEDGIDVSQLPNGLYFLKIGQSNLNKKIVVSH